MNRRFVILAVVPLVLAGCSVGESPSGSTPTGGVQCSYSDAGTAAKKVTKPSTTGVANVGTANIVIETSQGTVQIQADRAKVPCTINSLESLAKQKYFDGTICHRLTTKATGIGILQCGDPQGTGRGGPGYRFADELTSAETYGPGTVAMANAGPNTNGSQFFLVFEDSALKPNYTVIGKMDASSLAVVKKIAAGGTVSGAEGKPKLETKITKVTVG